MGQLSFQDFIDDFDALTKDVGKVQRETLHRILNDNADAEYLRNHGLEGRTDPHSFKACIPLVTHSDLEPYIMRIVNGDSSPVLTGKPITCISLSSGTSQGRPKFLPFNEDLFQATMQIYKTSFVFRNREFPIARGKGLQFIFGSKQGQTEGGLLATTATTNVFRHEQYKSNMREILSECCSPDEVIFGSDYSQSLYCHLLCGLIFSNEIQFVCSTFAHSIVHAFRTFEQVWEELCHDIRVGFLSDRITISSMRDAVSKLLRPDPDLADSIYNKCKRLSNWYGLIPEVWPNAKYVHGIMTGSMEPYLKKLRHYAGGLPLVSSEYGASEGWIGANVTPRSPPETVSFAVIPNIAYFEFIPLGEDASVQFAEPEPIGLEEVELGKEYEIILTSFAGLYRYRLGDVVRVAGFYNTTPQLQFVRRSNLLLNINIDKNTEKDLQVAVEEAAKLIAEEKLEVVDFTSYADRTTDPAHYVIYWELSGEVAEGILSQCCNRMDVSFLDAGYMSSRKVNAIGPLELRLLRRGTFHKIMTHYLDLGAAVSQYKTPRCVSPSNSMVLQILSNNVVENYFSTAYSR